MSLGSLNIAPWRRPTNVEQHAENDVLSVYLHIYCFKKNA